MLASQFSPLQQNLKNVEITDKLGISSSLTIRLNPILSRTIQAMFRVTILRFIHKMATDAIKHPEVAAMRISYEDGALLESTVNLNPFKQFESWFIEAKRDIPPPFEVNAMCLATATKQGRPSARMVLLKDYDEHGFVFFTNYNSRKSTQMIENPFAALAFYWSHDLCSRSIRIEGSIEKISEEDSVAYFKTRPRGSQIGAWSSEQSSVIEGGREELEKISASYEQKFANIEVIPKPYFWGGFVLKPDKMEFWQGRPNRLHDRLEFNKVNGKWNLKRLSP